MKNTKRLYHIQFNSHQKVELFIPRVPNSRAPGENETIPRICVADTFEGCLLAHPNFKDYAYTQWTAEHIRYNGSPYSPDRLKLRREEDTIGFLLRVYHFEVFEDSVKNPNEIAFNQYVPDIEKTNEHWITTPTKATNISYLFITEILLEENGPKFTYIKMNEKEFEQATFVHAEYNYPEILWFDKKHQQNIKLIDDEDFFPY